MYMVTKLVKVVIQREELSRIKSYDLSMRWSYEITCRSKNITSTFAEAK